VRKTISFICALALATGCSYALYFLFIEARGFYVWMLVMAAVGLFVAFYWLWEDFIRPLLRADVR
jgi:hypothetical protein